MHLYQTDSHWPQRSPSTIGHLFWLGVSVVVGLIVSRISGLPAVAFGGLAIAAVAGCVLLF